MGNKNGSDRSGDLILHREHARPLAVITLRPTMRPCPDVNQLRGDAHAIVDTPNAPLEKIPHAQFLADVAHVDSSTLVLKRGVTGDNTELREPRQLRYDVLGDTITEIVLTGIIAHV